jgi:sugar phosphate isomerase/epimerase
MQCNPPSPVPNWRSGGGMHQTRRMTVPPHRTARDLGPSDLVWDYFSRPRGDDTVAKIRAAAAAGYAAIGLYLGAWTAFRENPAELERVDEALAETGIVVANIETLRGWAVPSADPDDDSPFRRQEALAYEMAAHWGCRYVQVIGDADGPLDHAAAGFAALCDRAADHGLLVGLEWVPAMTNIGDATTALQIVTDADRPNGGFCADSWHFTRSTNNLDDLRQLPGDRVFATQWNDGSVQHSHTNSAADYLQDCLTNRVAPGDGEFALVDIVRILDAIGSTAPIGIEVCSTALWNGPVDEAARISADGMRKVLAEARA